MANPAETAAMTRAVALGAAAAATANPNPGVGCVVLDTDGRPLAEGATDVRGGPHAEIAALRGAGAGARGGTLVTTLEPCAAAGRTGACTTAISDYGVARVVYAVADPGEFGGGADLLRAGGIEVEGGLLVEPARESLGRWLVAAAAGRPLVTWKYAATLDGRTAAADGSSRWVTGAAARADVHALRARHDAVLVGVGTVLADDPHLTVRTGEPATGDWATGDGLTPLRVVADSHGRTPPGARVRDGAAPTLVATSAEVKLGSDGRLDPAALLALLGERGVRSVLLEGGATLAGSFVRAGLVDRVVGYVAPSLLGDGTAVLGDVGVTAIDAAIRLRLLDVGRCGDDVRIVAEVS